MSASAVARDFWRIVRDKGILAAKAAAPRLLRRPARGLRRHTRRAKAAARRHA